MADDTPPTPPVTARQLLRNPTRRYVPAGTGYLTGAAAQVIDGKPVFTWLDIPRMVRDPMVRFVERMWRSPFAQVKWRIRAEDPRVKKYVDESLRRFWQRSLPRMLSRYFRWGFAAGGAEFCHRRGLVRLDRVRAVEPADARHLAWAAGARKGEFAGFTARGVRVLAPHAMWFAGNQEHGPYYDAPPLSGMFVPWLEKNTRGGAIDARQTWFRKNAASGTTIYHPPGQSSYGPDENPTVRDNQDVAREIADYAQTNGVFTFENTPNPGMEGKYAWEVQEPKSRSDLAGFREYPQDLDKEMQRGAGIPPEVTEASEVGSGWSGRMIPLEAFLGGVDELAGLIVESADAWLRYAVDANFGRKTWYEVDPVSLVEQLRTQAAGGGPNPVPGLLGKGPPVEMSDGRDEEFRAIRRRADRIVARRRRRAIELSWSPYAGSHGGHGWQDSETGEIRYQKDKPGEASTAGPESAFQAHPGFEALTHPEHPLTPQRAASLRKHYHEKAEAEGIDPAELHRETANDLHDEVRRTVADEESRAARAKAAGQKHVTRAKLLPDQLLAKHYQRNLAYLKNKAAAGRFADSYFDDEDPGARSKAYMRGVDADEFDPDFLPEDTADAVAEDLGESQSHSQLLHHYAKALGTYGADSTAAKIAEKALGSKPAPAPLKFDGGKPDKWAVVDTSATSVPDEVLNALPKAATYQNGDSFVIPADDAAARKVLEEHGAAVHGAADDDGGGTLFDSLQSKPLVADRDVPASAKDTGSTSGGKGPEADWDPNRVDVFKPVDRRGGWYVVKRGSGNPEAETKGLYGIVHRSQLPPASRLPDVYFAGLADKDSAGTDADDQERTGVRAEKQSAEGASGKREITDTGSSRAMAKTLGKVKGEHKRTENLVRSDEALHDRATTWAAARSGELDPDEVNAPAREAVEDLHAALSDLEGLDGPDHEYDPDLVDDFDAADLGTQHGSRAEHAAAARDVGEEFTKHLLDAQTDVKKSRDRAIKTATAYRNGLRDRLKAVRTAAQKVLALPAHDIGDKDTADYYRQAAEQANREALKLTGRASRQILMSTGDGEDGEPDGPPAVAGVAVRAGDTGRVLMIQRANSPLDPAAGKWEFPGGHLMPGEAPADAAKREWAEEVGTAVPPGEPGGTWRSGIYQGHVWETPNEVPIPAGRGDHCETVAWWHPDDLAGNRGVRPELAASLPQVLPLIGGRPVEMSATDDEDDDAFAPVAKTRYAGKNDLVSAIVLAMMKAQAWATGRGNPDAARPYLDQLAALANDKDRLQEVLGIKSLAWVPYEGARGGKGWKNSDTGRVIYGHDKPGERRERQQASAAKARELTSKVLHGTATAADLTELADNIPALTVKQLQTARIKIGGSFGGKRRRDDMVRSLLDHVRRRVQAERAAVKKPKPSANKGQDSLVNVIKRHGGIDPESHDLLRHYESAKEATQNGIPVGVFKRGGMGLDTLASELHNGGHISVPEGRDAGEHLLEQLQKKAASHHADLTDQYQKAEEEYYRRAQEAADAAADRSEIAAAVRSGEEAGAAEEADGTVGEVLGEHGQAGGGDPGEEGAVAAGDAGDVDDSFDFGANAADAAEPTEEPEPPTPEEEPPATADPFESATADHTRALNAIPAGSLGWVAGYPVRHTSDGRFQVETGKAYRTGTAAEINQHIRDAWRQAGGEAPAARKALERAAAFQEPNWFGGGQAAEDVARRRAKVPEGARGVSLEPHTRGRVGKVVRDPETGAAHLLLDGQKEVQATDFEPLQSAFSWRTPEADKPEVPKAKQGDLFAPPASPPPPPVPPPPPPAAPVPSAGMEPTPEDAAKAAKERAKKLNNWAAAGGLDVPADTGPDKAQLAERIKAAAKSPGSWAGIAADLARPEVGRSEVVGWAKDVLPPDLYEQARKLPKAKIAELMKQHLGAT